MAGVTVIKILKRQCGSMNKHSDGSDIYDYQHCTTRLHSSTERSCTVPWSRNTCGDRSQFCHCRSSSLK